MPKVSIIIPTCGEGCKYLKDLVPVLLEEPDSELIIIDNKSIDQTLSFLERYRLHIKLIKNGANFGFSIANNQGSRIASGEYLVFLNNDTMVEKGFTGKLLLNFNNPKVGGVGCKIVDMNPPFGVQHGGTIMREDGYPLLVGHPDINHESVNKKKYYPFVTSACFMIKKTLYDEIGGYSESYRTSWEDSEICLRIYEKGYKVLYDPEVVVRHWLHGSPGRMDNEEFNVAMYQMRCIDTGLYKIAQEASKEEY